MHSRVCDRMGLEFPLFAFSHCRDVVSAVSRAGGMGILGASRLTPEQLQEELKWIDEHVDGKPYGVDMLVPNSVDSRAAEATPDQMLAMVPDEHKRFVNEVLNAYGIETDDLEDARRRGIAFSQNVLEQGAVRLMEVAFTHPIRLIVNALGVPPPSMMEMAREHHVPVGALVGTKEHALRHVAAGVDVLVVAGGEAGGHCGDVATMVLVPEVVEAVKAIKDDVLILAAGGIVTGRQMAAAMAMGADGAWTGSVWLTTVEAETNPVVKEKLLAAGSRDTTRSRSFTGKYVRQLRSPWTDAWQRDDAPTPLPMPLQHYVTLPAKDKIDKLSAAGHEGAKQLAWYFVGQGVGMMNRSMSARAVVQAFKEDYVRAFERLSATMED